MTLFGRPGYAHGDRIEAAGLPVRLAVNARARRISLRVDRAKREAVAIAPTARRLPEAVAFARERADWIAEQLAELPNATPLAPGLEVALFGQTFTLIGKPGRARLTPAVEGKPGLLTAPDDVAFGDRALRLMKGEARRWLTERSAVHCAALARPLPSVAVADPKGRWGSCRPASPARPAVIRYSWRLALAPAEVADYVAAHECAHLIEANHGPRFWALVRDLVGDPSPHRDWLRREGPRLHAFGRA